jgi:hypothetical protein
MAFGILDIPTASRYFFAQAQREPTKMNLFRKLVLRRLLQKHWHMSRGLKRLGL